MSAPLCFSPGQAPTLAESDGCRSRLGQPPSFPSFTLGDLARQGRVGHGADRRSHPSIRGRLLGLEDTGRLTLAFDHVIRHITASQQLLQSARHYRALVFSALLG
eukprot:scaffold12235_cov117-Isochrysis_galbana.AAC.4